MRMGLCFLREVVYNKLAMDVRAQAHLHRYRQCLTAGEKAIITLRADRGTGPEQGDYKIGKVCYYGRQALHGEVTISGAKNAAVGILPATILAADVCVIENLPDISDVAVSLKILSVLGAKVRMLNRNTYEIDTTHLHTTSVPDDLSRQMRASYYFLGALLSRFGKAQVAMPGGCNLGPRPIDQHLKVFSALGAEDSVDYGMISVRAEELNAARIFFDKVSVGATMNGMLSAVMAKGQTVLENCAKEPHVVDLANFLNMCGADIRGAGTDVIKVRGVSQLHGCTYSIIPGPDRGRQLYGSCGRHRRGRADQECHPEASGTHHGKAAPGWGRGRGV